MQVGVHILCHVAVLVRVGLLNGGIVRLETLGANQGVVNGMHFVGVIVSGIRLQFGLGGSIAEAIDGAALLSEACLFAPGGHSDFLHGLVVQYGLHAHLVNHVGAPHKLRIGVLVIVVVLVHEPNILRVVVDSFLCIGLAICPLEAVGEVGSDANVEGRREAAILLDGLAGGIFLFFPLDFIAQRDGCNGMIAQAEFIGALLTLACIGGKGHTGEGTTIGIIGDVGIFLQLGNIAFGEHLFATAVEDFIGTAVLGQRVSENLVAHVEIDNAIVHSHAMDQVGVHLLIGLVLFHLSAEGAIILIGIFFFFLTVPHIAGVFIGRLLSRLTIGAKAEVEDDDGFLVLILVKATHGAAFIGTLRGLVRGAHGPSTKLICIGGVVTERSHIAGRHAVHQIAVITIHDVFHGCVSAASGLHIVECAGVFVVNNLAAGLAEPRRLIGGVVADLLLRINLAFVVIEHLATVVVLVSLSLEGIELVSLFILIIIVDKFAVLVKIGQTNPAGAVIEGVNILEVAFVLILHGFRRKHEVAVGNVAQGLYPHLRGGLGGDIIIAGIHIVPGVLFRLVLIFLIRTQLYGVKIVDGVEHGVAIAEAGAAGGHAGLGNVGEVLDLDKVYHIIPPEIVITGKPVTAVLLKDGLNQPGIGGCVAQADAAVLVLQLILTGEQRAENGHADGLDAGIVTRGCHIHQRLHVKGGIFGQPVVHNQIDLNIGHGRLHAGQGILQHGICHGAIVHDIRHESLIQHGGHVLQGIIGNKEFFVHVAEPLNRLHWRGITVLRSPEGGGHTEILRELLIERTHRSPVILKHILGAVSLRNTLGRICYTIHLAGGIIEGGAVVRTGIAGVGFGLDGLVIGTRHVDISAFTAGQSHLRTDVDGGHSGRSNSKAIQLVGVCALVIIGESNGGHLRVAILQGAVRIVELRTQFFHCPHMLRGVHCNDATVIHDDERLTRSLHQIFELTGFRVIAQITRIIVGIIQILRHPVGSPLRIVHNHRILVRTSGGDFLGLGFLTNRAGIGLFASRAAGGLRGHHALVPGVACRDYLGLSRHATLGLAGVNLFTRLSAGRLLGHLTSIPVVVFAGVGIGGFRDLSVFLCISHRICRGGIISGVS